MINDYPHKYMPEKISELPDLIGAEYLYIDFETTSGDDKKDSINPWVNCDILGIAITVDDVPDAWYVPLRHRVKTINLDIERVYRWLRGIVSRGRVWINSNVLYDAHVGTNYAGLNLDHLELWDTVTLAKIIDSDRFTYGLKTLSKVWLGEDISEYEKEIRKYTHLPSGNIKIHDFAVIGEYEMYKYATQDSLSVRRLFHYIKKNLPSECQEVWDVECRLTKELYYIERNGLRVDPKKLWVDASKRIPNRLREINEELLKITGQYFRPCENPDCYDIICVQYGCPVLEWTAGGKDKTKKKPSFNKDALKAYKTYEQVPICVIELIEEYRHLDQLLTTFTRPYIDKMLRDHSTEEPTVRVHGSFNQAVRTGRMSMSQPNMMQVSPEAKEYILPDLDCVLVEFDLKQIEYRYVATYIENKGILDEYRTNPKADYHSMMAELCEIDRDPAKAVNFASSFRAGKARTITMIRAAFDMKKVPEGVDFEKFIVSKGEEVYATVHRKVPELKRNWYQAQRACAQRGYTRNAFNRRRHIKGKGVYMAFPNIIQSSAADLMKRITIRLCDLIRESPVKLNCIVHDSWLFNIPADFDTVVEWTEKIKECIESTESRLSVPLYASMELSGKNWRDCK